MQVTMLGNDPAQTLGNPWLALATFATAPPKGGVQVIRTGGKSSSGLKPEHIAVAAVAAAAAYLALG